MLRQVKKLLAFILALALVFTTFTSDYTSAKVFAEGENTEEQDNSEDESEDEEESEDEDSEDEDSEDEDSNDEESDDEEASDEESEEEPKEEIPEEEIPEEEIPEEEVPEEEAEESEEDEEGRIVITYSIAGEGGSITNEKESFDPESEEEITLEGSTAEDVDGFKFVGWTGGYLEETFEDYTFVPDYTLITENVEFTANYEAEEEPEEEKLRPVKDSTVVNGIKISLHAEEGILPVDAKLVVKTLEDSDGVSISEEDVKEAVDAATEETVTATYSFDINIYSEEAGGYVQPEDGSVKITFDVVSDEINSAIEDTDTEVAVYYIAEDGGDIEGVDKVADISDKVEFETDHFSVYTVVLKNGAVTNDNNLGFTIKFRDYEKHSTKLKTEDSADEVAYEIGEEIITPSEIAKKLNVEQIIYNGEKYVFAEAVDGGSNNRKIEFFYVEKPENSNKYLAYYKAVGSDQKYTIGGAGSDVYFYYIKSVKSSNQMTIAIRDDGQAPSEPWIYRGEDYTFIADGGSGGFNTGDVSKYISISDVSETEITTVSTSPYDGKSYKVYAIAGIDSVHSKLTQKFIDYANQKAKTHGKLHDGEYIDWYVIKYQTNDNVWHIDGVVRKSSKLTLNYDKNIPEGSSYSGHWPTGRQYDVNPRTKTATAIVEGEKAVKKEGKEFITRPGYTFLGWNTDKNATVATYTEDSTITFSQDTTLYAIWQRNKVNVKLTYKYNDGKTADKDVSPLKSDDVVDIIDNPTREGYEFKGWKSDIAGDTNTYGRSNGQKNKITMPEKDVILTAQWEAVSVGYTVKWRERVTNKTLRDDDTSRKGVTGTRVYANQPNDKTITGYTYDNNSIDNVVVAANGSSVITLYFTINSHDIKYVLAQGSAVPTDYKLPDTEENVKFGTEKTRAAVPDIAGYSFEGWTTEDVIVADDGKFKMPDNDVTFTGKFTAQEVDYTVSWWEKTGEMQYSRIANNDGDQYVTRKAVTGTEVEAQNGDLSVEGYSFVQAESTTKVTVAGDGTSEIKLVFEKNTYKIHYRFDGFVHKDTVPYNTADPSKPYADQEYKYKEHVVLADVLDPELKAADGYTFSGWTLDPQHPEAALELEDDASVITEIDMEAHDVYLVGSFTADTNIKYIIEHYKQNVDDDNYPSNPDLTETFYNGVTGQPVENYVISFGDGFVHDTQVKADEFWSIKEGQESVQKTDAKVLGDGSLVIRVYYQRQKYWVRYSYDNTLPEDATVNPTRAALALENGSYTKQYKFGQHVPVAANAEAKGFEFLRWDYSSWKETEIVQEEESIFTKLGRIIGLSKAETAYFEMPAADVSIIGTFKTNTYTVTYVYDPVPASMREKDLVPTPPNNGEPIEVAYGKSVDIEADPEAVPGYYFKGWEPETEAGVETVTVVDGKFDMPADNVIIKGSFAEKLKVTIVLKTPGENTDRLYNGQVQEVNTDIGVVVEGGDDPDLAEYIKEQVSSAGLQALSNIRDFFVITAYAYDDSLDLGEDPEITESGITVGGYTVTAPIGIDANKDRPGTADADKKLVGREKDYPIVFNGSDMTITKDGADLRDVADITVVDADGNEVTDLSGGITIGYLTIIPREVTLTSGSASRVANGTALTSPAVAISGDGFVAAVKDGETGDEIEVDKLKAEGAIGTITNPGSVENKIDEIGKFKTGFFRADTNYVIKEVIGTLTITSGGGGGDDTPDTPGTPTIPDAPVPTAPAPTGAVLGAQRDVPVDGPAVLGARRAGTDDSTNRTARAFVILVSAAVALSLMIVGKKKRENEEE